MIFFGLKILASGIFKSFFVLFGIFSMYLIVSYEKYPDKIELIGGKFFGISKLNSSIILSIFFFGLPFSFIDLFL